jgi:hypothetical protein
MYENNLSGRITEGVARTRGFAILGQKQYPSALVRYWASARAEVFQCSFLFLSSSLVFQLGSDSGQKIFKFPNIVKPHRWQSCKTTTQLNKFVGKKIINGYNNEK